MIKRFVPFLTAALVLLLPLSANADVISDPSSFEGSSGFAYILILALSVILVAALVTGSILLIRKFLKKKR